MTSSADGRGGRRKRRQLAVVAIGCLGWVVAGVSCAKGDSVREYAGDVVERETKAEYVFHALEELEAQHPGPTPEERLAYYAARLNLRHRLWLLRGAQDRMTATVLAVHRYLFPRFIELD